MPAFLPCCAYLFHPDSLGFDDDESELESGHFSPYQRNCTPTFSIPSGTKHIQRLHIDLTYLLVLQSNHDLHSLFISSSPSPAAQLSLISETRDWMQILDCQSCTFEDDTYLLLLKPIVPAQNTSSFVW